MELECYLEYKNMENHNCDNNKVTNCDGETHTHFCALCGKFLGETDCPEKGTW